MLSYRGSERQPPNMFQLSLRSSLAMEERANQGLHRKDWPAEVRLRKIVEEFHQSCLNLICGTTPESRSVIRAHLHAHKWALSAFNAELLRRPRWLLGAVPKQAGDLKQTLTVDAQSQNQRGRACLSNSDWDRYVNFACVFKSVMHEASLFILGDVPC